MKVLFIGGTGNISGASSRLAMERGIDLYHLNRGTRERSSAGITTLTGDINNLKQVRETLKDHSWDAVVNWIAFTPDDVKRDIGLFKGKTKQYIFISSASAYQKPPASPFITESTPLRNPYWEYSRNKIACEEELNNEYRLSGFPVTVVRPSLTYDTVIPVAIGSWNDYTIVDRMKKGKKVVVHGDGSSLWTVTHSEDFARGFVGLLGHQQAVGHSFHITSDEVLTWDQIYQAVADAAGAEARIVHVASDFICAVDPSQTGNLLGDKACSAVFDNSKIKAFVPGFKAEIPFALGIRKTVSWFEEYPSRMKIVADHNKTIDRILDAYAKVFPDAK